MDVFANSIDGYSFFSFLAAILLSVRAYFEGEWGGVNTWMCKRAHFYDLLFFPHLLFFSLSLSCHRSFIQYTIHSLPVALFIYNIFYVCSWVFVFWLRFEVVFCCLLLCRCCCAAIICKFYKLDVRYGTQWHIANKFYWTEQKQLEPKKNCGELCSLGKNRIFVCRKKKWMFAGFFFSLFWGEIGISTYKKFRVGS